MSMSCRVCLSPPDVLENFLCVHPVAWGKRPIGGGAVGRYGGRNLQPSIRPQLLFFSSAPPSGAPSQAEEEEE